MAKWKNDNGPALWPIDMSQISRVHFVAIPQTDVSSVLTEVEISRESSKIPECPIDLKTNATLYSIIDILCKRLGRRTPDSPDCTKGTLNTDVLRSVLEETILSIKVPNEHKTNTELGQEQVGKSTNEWGMCYDDLRNSYVDVEYETIFGNAKITILKYGFNSQPLVIEAKCEQCLVTRDDNGSIAGIDDQELRDIEWQNGPFCCSVKSVMIYAVSVLKNNKVIKTAKITIQRPLEFIYGAEYLTFLEDGPEQSAMPLQRTILPFYIDQANFLVTGSKCYLELNGITVDLGDKCYCRANIASIFFKRANSNPRKTVELMDLYNTLGNSTKSWEEPGVSETFAGTVSAARIKLNNDIAKMFKLGDTEVFLQNKKQIFINSKFLSPLDKTKQKSET